jgi:hypothetical protein
MRTTIVNIRDTYKYDVFIGRPSKWGNPFIEGKHGTREEVVELYRQYIRGNEELKNVIPELRGKILGCYCKPDLCHGDILAGFANGEIPLYNLMVIGIDQSYERTGISIAADGKLLKVSSLDFTKLKCKNKTEKRFRLQDILQEIITKNIMKADEIMIIVERIRTFSQGKKCEQGFGLKPDYLKSIGALTACIVDIAYKYDVPVYSVDTRSWKAQVLGKSFTIKEYEGKYEKPEKAAAIRYIRRLGFDTTIRDKDGQPKVHQKGKNAGLVYYDDDACDSGCIALYGFCKNRLLQLEE